MTATITPVDVRTLVEQFHGLLAQQRGEEWAMLFAPDGRLEFVYPAPPMPTVIAGRRALADALAEVGDRISAVHVDLVSVIQTTDRDVVIAQHRLRADLPGGGSYDSAGIGVFRLRDGLIDSVLIYDDSAARAEAALDIG